MRVAAVLESFPRGSERFLARELAALAGHGIEPVIFSLRPGDPAAWSDEPFAGLRAAVRHLPPAFSLRTAVAKLGQLGRVPAAAALLPDLLGSFADDPRRTAALIPRLAAAWSLAREARRAGCALIWALWASRPGAVGLLAARIAGLPFAVSAHAWDVFVNRAMLRAQLRRAALATACNSAAADRLRQLAGPAAAKIHLVPHGLGVPEDLAPPRPAPAGRPMRVLGAGRLVIKKGFTHLLAAAAVGGFEVEIAGDGPERGSLEAQAARLGLGARARFLGGLGWSELSRAFARCDALCAPSVVAPDGDRDGVPNILLEGTIAGLPAVCTAVGGLPDFARHERTALVVAAGDPGALAAAVCRLATEPDLGTGLVSAARGLIRERFEVDANAARLAALLRRAADAG